MSNWGTKLERTILVVSLIVITSVITYGQDPTESIISVNNISSWVRNDGFHPALVKEEGLDGNLWNGNFPIGTAGGVYSEGLVWGGKVYDGKDTLVRVNGNTYGAGNYPISRLFRTRNDYKTVDLKDDAAKYFRVTLDQVTQQMIDAVYNQYQKDWNEWPADKGAPYDDKNKNGIYESNIDIPGIPGAAQTVWISYDDRNSYNTYRSAQIGVEVQETYWAYNDNNKDNAIYKTAKLIYKGLPSSEANSHIDSMYFSEFVDIDDGSYGDDFVGYDSSLNLGYVYNSVASDDIYKDYFSSSTPAIGYVFLHGVAAKTGNLSDSAIVNFKWRKGYKYFNSKPLTVFIAHASGGYFSDPALFSYDGTLQYYNMMRGYQPYPEYPASQPFSDYNSNPIGGYGTYLYAGDPINKTGWYDGIMEPSGDRRMWLMSGPFSLQLGDTAEISTVLVGGLGSDNLNSITILKNNVNDAITGFYDLVGKLTEGYDFITGVVNTKNLPNKYLLYQNYPNPFNPTTTIKYELPKDAFVKLVVYDILGREVRTLVNEQKSAGSYKVIFDGSNLPSGVYFYRITFTNLDSRYADDNLSKVNKLMLIK